MLGYPYEAKEVRECLENGKKESDIMPLQHTQIVANIMDNVLEHLGRPSHARSITEL